MPIDTAAKKVPEEKPQISGVSPTSQMFNKFDFPNELRKQISQRNYLAERQKDLSDVLFKII